MTNEQVLSRIKQEKIIAIIRGVKREYIIKTAQAILDGGITCLEITFNHITKDAPQETYESIRLLCREFGNSLCIGAGTVLTEAEVEMAVNAGADYIISPDTNTRVIQRTKELNKVSIPGALTPTEAVQAYNAGGDVIKLFPAAILGTSYIKAFRGPLEHIPIAAVGGITPDNSKDFIDAGCMVLGIGGKLVDVNAIELEDFITLTKVARQYRKKLQLD